MTERTAEAGIAFGDLPRPGMGTARTLHSLVAAQLRLRPQEWACIDTRSSTTSAANTAHSVRTAKIRSYAPAGAFEAHARTVAGRHEVWVRYVGEPANG